MSRPGPAGDRSPPADPDGLQLGEIVLTAAGLDGSEREPYLDEIAGAEDLGDSFLDTPAAARLSWAAADGEAPPPAAALLVTASVVVAVFALRADAARKRAELRQGQAEGLIGFMVGDLRKKLESLGRLDVLDDVGGEAEKYFAAVPAQELSEAELAAAQQPFEAYLATSQRLVEMGPDNLKWRRELSYAHSNLGSVREAEGALEQFRASLALDEDLAAAEPASRDAKFELAASHNTVGVVLQDLGRWSEAGEQLRAEFEIRKSLLAADPASFRMREFMGTSHSRLGIQLSMLGSWSAAGDQFEQARAIFTKLVAHDPSNASWCFKLAWSYLHLGRVAFARGDLAAAAAAWARERRLIDELLARDDAPHAWRRTQAVGLYHLALLERARGEPARAHLLSAVKILEGLAASRPTDREVHRWLSQSYLLLGTLEDSRPAATADFQRATAAIEPFARGGRDGRVLAPWVIALRCLGRPDEARPEEKALSALGYSPLGLDGLCGGLPRAERETS